MLLSGNGIATAERAPTKRSGPTRLVPGGDSASHAGEEDTGTPKQRSVPISLLDIGLALVLLVVCAPVIGVLILLVRCTSRGPVIYAQTRVGLRGRSFRIYKIRSMPHNVEATSGPVWATLNDRRSTWIGTWLRRYHLDELPQLINVLRGDMSLVGPRPERPEFTQRLAVQIPGFLERLDVRPGVTGLAQINVPADGSLECIHCKTVIDRKYIACRSPWLDMRIIVATAFLPFGKWSAAPRRWLGVYEREESPPLEPTREPAFETPVVTPLPQARLSK
jgi:lipopolysaccharide/colanic/teichoic acid biosynthesis glycosyltransferase